MDMQIALRHAHTISPSPFWRRLRWLGFALLAAGVWQLLWSAVPGSDNTSATPIAPLVHWRDADHDWLLVVDPQTRELVVYDASDGRPLQRLGAEDGVPPAQSIVLQGPWLFVMGGQHPKVRLLKLPQLQVVTANPG
jgi:hypothetical protein